MKQITLYQCEHCKYSSTDRHECLEHEAKEHYHITMDEYNEWRQLTKEAEHAGWEVGNYNNPDTRAKFDKIIIKLIDFEKQHNLPDKRPMHF